jgi:hypothetical protein
VSVRAVNVGAESSPHRDDACRDPACSRSSDLRLDPAGKAVESGGFQIRIPVQTAQREQRTRLGIAVALPHLAYRDFVDRRV